MQGSAKHKTGTWRNIIKDSRLGVHFHQGRCNVCDVWDKYGKFTAEGVHLKYEECKRHLVTVNQHTLPTDQSNENGIPF